MNTLVAPGTTNNPSVTMCNVTFNGNTADDDNSTYTNNDNVYASNTSSLNPTGYISSNATTICTGGSIQLSFIPNSGTGPFDIVVNGVTYNDVPSGSVFLTRTEGTHFTGTTHFNLTQITDANNCVISGLAQTITINVNTVNAGSISGDQMVCAGGDPNNLTSMTNGSGPGTVTYRWESSTTNCSSGFFPIMGATGATYDPPVGITQTTFFRRVTISTLNGFPCEAIAPNCIVIVVLNPQGGTIAGDQAICSGADPAAFTSGVAGSGNAGTITYRWESSTTNCNSGFTPIMGATGLTYDPSAVSQTTYFRRVTIATFNGVANGACEAVSNCVTVTVQDNELPTIVCPTGSTTSFGQSDGNTNFTSISTFQSFTPVSSGDITSITIYLNTASSNLTLQVQSGSTCDGTILGSKTFNGVVGFQTITFDTPIPVTGGIQYNFGIVGTISSAANYTGSYSGGRAYLGGCPGLDMIFQNYDLVFTITMSVPGPVTLNNDPGTCAATYVILDPILDNCPGATWSASFSGNVNGNPASFSNIPDGSNSNSLTFQKGTTNVVLTGMDAVGNLATCSVNVIVTDNQDPTFSCPSNQDVNLNATCQLSVPDLLRGLTGNDNCGTVTFSQSPTAGTLLASSHNQTHTVTITAADGNGNTSTCEVTLTGKDVTDPTITCPATQTLVLGANCTATLPDYTSLATTGDNCGVQSVTQSPTAGTSVSGAGNMTVTLTVTDLNGNETECTFTVTKVDNTAPTITCPATQTLALGANCTATLPDYTSLATTGDNCGIQSVTQSPTAGMTVSGAGNMTVTLTVTDINGNETECTFTVTKVDNTSPTVSCPTTQTLVLGANCTATLPDYTSLATTGDNCGIQSVKQSPTAGTTVSGAGNMTVTLTVTDLNGNETECTFTVTKVDNMAPTITCPTTQTLVLGANCTATLPDYTSLATTADNCGIQSVKQSPTAGTTASGAGNMPVTLTVTDLNGNETECTFTVTKVDNTPPTLVCKNTTVFIGNTGTYTLQPADVFNATASSDNCSGVLTVTNISPAMVSCAQLNQIIPVTVTVQDASGNTATCTAQITVQEGSALPLGWSNDNIGNANGAAGYKACSFNGSFTVSANGFSTSSLDVLHFTSQQLCGNGEITVRVMAVSGGGWAGVMMRESLSPVAKKVVLKTQLSSMIRREIRTVQTAPASILNFNRPQHVWLRLVRDGSTFTGYTSLNGTTWSFAFSATVSMAGCIQLGVFSESINANTTTTATFSNISVTGASNSSLTNGLPDTQVAAEEDEQVRIFPNPTTGEVTIDLDIYAGKPGTIQVFNALGALTTQERLIPGNPETHQLLLGDIAGVYTVVIQLEDSKIVRRVVVQAE